MGAAFGRPLSFPATGERTGLRFISKHQNYLVIGQPETTTVIGQDGRPYSITNRWDADVQFHQHRYGPPLDHEIKAARDQMVFTGTSFFEDEVTPWPIEARLGVFDTVAAQQAEGWSDEQRELIEKKLLSLPDFGSTYILVELPRTEKPWPKYDDLRPVGRRTIKDVAEKIAEMTADLGIDPGMVVAYERENQNRPEVLAALEAIGAEQVEDEITVTA